MKISKVFPVILRIKFQFLTVAYMALYIWIYTHWFNLLVFYLPDPGNEASWDTLRHSHRVFPFYSKSTTHSPLNFVPLVFILQRSVQKSVLQRTSPFSSKHLGSDIYLPVIYSFTSLCTSFSLYLLWSHLSS